MNIMYCGDRNIEDGLIISVLSLLKNVREPLNIMVLTMTFETEEKKYEPVTKKTIEYLDARVKESSADSSVSLMDVTDLFGENIPQANLGTRFTPCCMLRLLADELPDIPDRVLYLDNDVVCRKDCSEFYHQDLEEYELAGVLDYYGRWFFRNNIFKMDYLNSGILLLNMRKIKETGLFKSCRDMCRDKQMFMPDQSAINKLAKNKKICKQMYNEQRKLRKNTVFQHFTTSFRFLPWLHTLTVKPWDIERVHSELKLFEYDDILDQYTQVKNELRKATV